MTITVETLTNMALPLLFYFAVGTLGAFTKDLYETMTNRIEKIRLGEILVGGVVATIICYGLEDSWLKGFSLNTMFLVTFTIGVLGFEIFGNMTNISKIRNLLLVVDEVRKGIPPAEGTSIPTEIEDTAESPSTTNTGRNDAITETEHTQLNQMYPDDGNGNQNNNRDEDEPV